MPEVSLLLVGSPMADGPKGRSQTGVLQVGSCKKVGNLPRKRMYISSKIVKVKVKGKVVPVF